MAVRFRLTRLALGALLCGVAPQMAAAAATKTTSVPPIVFKQRVLANGLRVIAIRDTSTPDVMVSMWYEVGSKHDPEGRSGFAHLFEHILSRKTVNMPYNAINRMVDDVGGTRNASTWYDRTNYFETVPAEYLERMLWTHAERMARPVVDKEVFETERNVVKEELRQRVLAPPYGRFFSFAVGENVYNVVPHRRPTIGSIADLDSATLEDARAFHEAYYGPDTATLLVSGNFDPQKLNALVDKYFAPIPRRAKPISLAIKQKDTPVKPRMVQATGPNVPLPLVGATYQLPGASHRDMAALEVMDAVLATGNHSRLDTALVKQGLAASVGTNLNQTEEESYYAAYAFVAQGKEQEAVASALDSALARMRTSGPTAAELSEAKNELLAATLGGRETADGRAFELGERLVRTGDPANADKRIAQIARVTSADVKRVAALYLNPARRLELRYRQGDGNAAGWANPTPLPRFASVPAASRAPNALRPEAERDPLPAAGDKPSYSQPAIAEDRLANGMRLLTSRTGSVPLATLSVVIKSGTATDSRDKAGRALLAAQIADRGTPTRSAEQIATSLERLGASLNAGADPDGTVVSVTAPAATLREASMILADVVRNASYPEADFQRERRRALDGLKIAMRDPGQLASMLVLPVAYGSSPYGIIPRGTSQTLTNLSRDDLLAYRQNWWRPELSSVIVSGGIDPATAKSIAASAFGDWQSPGPAPSPMANVAAAAPAGRTLVVDLPGAGQAAVYAVVRGPARGDASYYDTALANSVLGGSTTSRLFTEIRVKRGLSYGSQSNLDALLGGGAIIASAQTKNESAAEVVKVMLDEFRRLSNEPLDATNVETRKTFMTGRYRRLQQTSAGFNANLAGQLLRGLQPADVVAYPQRLAAVTGAGATAAFARIAKPENISIVIVGDASKFADKLKALRPDALFVPADKLDLASAGAAAAAP